MSNELQVFKYMEEHQIRTTVIDGEVWFVAKDVCSALGIQNPSDAIRVLDEDEKSGVEISAPHGRVQETRVISESGLYALIFRSNKPEAKQFSRWVRRDVLPSIRKSGMYLSDKAADAPPPVHLSSHDELGNSKH